MLNLGTKEVCMLDDDWTIVTEDEMPSAHFEHTVVVTEDGYEILTGDKI
jgi:methionyl aminopeptidase